MKNKVEKSEYQQVLDSIRESYAMLRLKSTKTKVSKIMVDALSELHVKINYEVAEELERRKTSPTQRSVRRELEKLGVPEMLTPTTNKSESSDESTVETSAKKPIRTFGK